MSPRSPAWPTELVETTSQHRVLPAEAQDCPACEFKARLESDDLGERFACTSCAQVVCIKHKKGAICSVCAAAFASLPSQAPVVVEAAFPKAKEWRSARGAMYVVSIGKPSGWAILTKPRLFVTFQERIVYDRELRKEEFT